MPVLSQGSVAILGIILCFLPSSRLWAQTSQPSAMAEKDVSSQLDVLSELSIEELSEVKITSIASGSQKLISEAPAIASVLTAAEMERMGATTLEDALNAIPGMHVSDSGQVSAPRYMIRGSATGFNAEVLVLINGVPISSIVRGDRNGRLGSLPLKFISRVEVIRGPGSARFGADAFAGVINVVTKSAGDIKGSEMGGHAGSYDTYEAWALHGHQYEDLKLTLMFFYSETQGNKKDITADAQTALDQAAGTHASLAPGPANLYEKTVAVMTDLERNKWHLRASYHGKYDMGTGYGATGALDPHGRGSRTRALIDLTYHDPNLSENWDYTSVFSFMDAAQEYSQTLYLFPPGANLGHGVFANGVLGEPQYFERAAHWDHSVIYTGFEKHRDQLGIGYAWQNLYRVQDSTNFTPNFTPRPDLVNLTESSDINLPTKARHSFSFFAQDEWSINQDWDMTNGIRWDQYSDFGNTVNPRSALIWRSTPKLTSKFLYGRAFRAPAFAELYTVNNPVVLGNPNIRPETTETYELGWIYKTSENWESGFNIFHFDTKDLISFTRDPGGTSTAQNANKQNGNGFEFETSVKASRDLLLAAHYAYVTVKDSETGKSPGDFPNDKAYLRSDWNFRENWMQGTQVTWVGPRDREPNDSRGSLRGSTTVDFILRKTEIANRYTVLVALKNVFDDDVREPSPGPSSVGGNAVIPNDLPQAGRNGFVEVSYKF